MAKRIWGDSLHKRSLIWIDNRTEWDRAIALEIALNLTDSSSVTAQDCGIAVHLATDASHASSIAEAYDHSLIFPIGWVTCLWGDFIIQYSKLEDPNDWRKLEHVIFKIPPTNNLDQINNLNIKTSRDRCCYYATNTEDIHKLKSYDFKEIVMPCSGLMPWVYASQSIRPLESKRFLFFDSSPLSVSVYKDMCATWDGRDYPTWLRSYAGSNHFNTAFFRQIKNIDTYWLQVQTQVHEACGYDFWEVWQQSLRGKYTPIAIHGDLMDTSILTRLEVANRPDTLMSFSNIMDYVPATYLNSYADMRNRENNLNKYLEDNLPLVQIIQADRKRSTANSVFPWRQ
jgi:hypothetical protein